MKNLLLTFFLLTAFAAGAQESNDGKKLWAKSILNEKAPELVVQKWISKKPDFQGKFVLIDFWATWCGPCRVYIPTLNALHEKYSDRLIIVGLSDENEETVKNFSNPKIKYYEAIDTKAKTKSALAVVGIPHAVLLDPAGIVRWEGFPLLQGFQLTEEVIVKIMDKYKNAVPAESK